MNTNPNISLKKFTWDYPVNKKAIIRKGEKKGIYYEFI